MITYIEGIGLQKGIETSLATKLISAITSLRDGDAVAATENVQTFINFSEARKDKKFPRIRRIYLFQMLKESLKQ